MGSPAKCVKTYEGHVNTMYCAVAEITKARDGADGKAGPQYIAAGSEDHKVYLWDLQTRQVVQTLEGHTDVVLAVASHPKRNIIASGACTNDSGIRIWTDDGPEDGDDDAGRDGEGGAEAEAEAEDRDGRAAAAAEAGEGAGAAGADAAGSAAAAGDAEVDEDASEDEEPDAKKARSAGPEE